MKYNYQEGIEKPADLKRLILPALIVLGLVYAAVNYFSPEILYVVEAPDTTAKRLIAERPSQGDNRLYIPKINADITILGDGSTERGATQPSPTSGNPKEGGNYVLSAARFSLGLTPMDTEAKSPFYHLPKLSQGDDIYLDYEGVRYAYKIEERKTTDDIGELTQRTDDPRLTLYTDETGSREVIMAKQVGTIVWTSGQPKLQPLPDD